MNRHLAIKTTCFCVVKLRNSPAITHVSRLESEYFNQQSIRPRLNQRFLKYQCGNCSEKAELIIGGTMSANMKPKVCTHCKKLINKVIKLRRISGCYSHYLDKEMVEDIRKGKWHISYKDHLKSEKKAREKMLRYARKNADKYKTQIEKILKEIKRHKQNEDKCKHIDGLGKIEDLLYCMDCNTPFLKDELQVHIDNHIKEADASKFEIEEKAAKIDAEKSICLKCKNQLIDWNGSSCPKCNSEMDCDWNSFVLVD